MNNTNNKKPLSQKIIEEIHKGAPQIPRYYFFIKNSGFWVLTVVLNLIGGLIVAAFLFAVIDMPKHEPDVPPDGPVMLLYVVPAIWIILSSIFVYLAYKATRKTEFGYKYKLSTIIISLLFTTILLGFLFYQVGTGFLLNDKQEHSIHSVSRLKLDVKNHD